MWPGVEGVKKGQENTRNLLWLVIGKLKTTSERFSVLLRKK